MKMVNKRIFAQKPACWRLAFIFAGGLCGGFLDNLFPKYFKSDRNGVFKLHYLMNPVGSYACRRGGGTLSSI